MTTQTLTEHPPRPESTSSVPRRILIVDGDPSTRTLLTGILSSDPSPIEPVVVESAGAALRILRSGEKVDFLLTDLRLPDMDGLELLVAARKSRPGLRMIAMTASPSEEAQRAAFDSGALQLLAKPLDVESLPESLFSDRPGSLSHLEGDLDLIDVCQLSAACQTDGGVRIHGSAGGDGVLIHRGGTLIYAATQALSGLEAFRDLLARSHWRFDSQAGLTATHAPVNCELALAGAPRHPGSRAAGTLRRLTLRHLIEWAMRGRQTCDLLVTSQGRKGVLSFDAGKVRSAETGGRQGGLAAAEILTWEDLRVAVTRSTWDPPAESTANDFAALIDRFSEDVEGFLGTGVIRAKDRSPVASRVAAPHLAWPELAGGFARLVEAHLAAVAALGGTKIWGETEDLLITTAQAHLLIRLLGTSHYHWLAVSREANLGMCRLLMRSFETFLLGGLAGLGEIH